MSSTVGEHTIIELRDESKTDQAQVIKVQINETEKYKKRLIVTRVKVNTVQGKGAKK